MNNSEVKHDVYGKRQNGTFAARSLRLCVQKMKLLVFAMNSRRRYSIFARYIYGKELKSRSYLCRLPSVLNVLLILSIKHFFRKLRVAISGFMDCSLTPNILQHHQSHGNIYSEEYFKLNISRTTRILSLGQKKKTLLLDKKECNSDEIVESMVCFKLSIVAFFH